MWIAPLSLTLDLVLLLENNPVFTIKESYLFSELFSKNPDYNQVNEAKRWIYSKVPGDYEIIPHIDNGNNCIELKFKNQEDLILWKLTHL